MVPDIGTGTEFTEPVTFSVPVWYRHFRFLPSNTGIVPVPNRTGYIRYRHLLLGIFGTGTFGSVTGSVPVGTELVPISDSQVGLGCVCRS
ncbi:hypothetical protein Hanom_Chr17g01561951 [Helianthus anomalus]